MKNLKKKFTAAFSAAVFIALASLALIFLSSNGKADNTAATNNDVTVRTVSEEHTVLVPGENYLIIFSSDANQIDSEIAASLRSQLSKSGQRVNVKSDAIQKETDYEILIGNTNRALSQLLHETCQAYVHNDSLVWGFAFRDGKFAYAAANDESFERGKSELFERFVGEDFSFSVPTDLWLIVSLSREDYEAELKAEQDRIEAEKEAARLQRIEELKNLISGFTFEDFTDYVTLDYTVMPNSTNWGSPALYPTVGEHPRVNVTKYMLDYIGEYLTTEEGSYLYNELMKLANTDYDGILDPAYEHTSGRRGFHNMSEKGLAIIEAKAFAYLITGDEEYGYQAILAMKNFFKTMDIRWIYSDQCREFGRIIYCGAEVYDWCYDLLTEDDKNHFIVAITDICASEVAPEYSGKCQSGDRQIEVGYPPSGQGSVSGHGSEHQILRDYLSVAIAIFDENPSWYEYVGGRVYNDYIVTRNYYYQSGTYQQGIFNYGPFRHNADLWSAWLLLSATGENPYSDKLQSVTNSFFEYQAPDGSFFGTGDGSRPTNATSRMIYDSLLVSALYADASLRTRVLSYWNNFEKASGLSVDMSFAHIIILSASYFERTGTTEGADIHDGKEVIAYHSYPIGQMIARSEWNNSDAPAVFMKIGEKTTANHEHADAGSFQIYYKGLYSGESGVYDSYGSTHFVYYHQATVAHNSLLVFNPDAAEYELNGESTESSSNLAKCFYSGGQRRLGETSTLQSWLNNSSYDTGEVTGHEYVLNSDGSADYAYLAGDISSAYQAPQVSYVGRRMLSIFTDNTDYPLYFIVYDSITAASENYVKKFLLHTPTEPIIDEDAKTVILTDKSGKLVLHTLKGGDAIDAIGGDGMNYAINGIQCATSVTGSDGMWGRIEISNSGTLSSEFLSFMYVTDAANEGKLSPAFIETDLVIGTQIGSDVIIFAKSAERNSEELIFDVDGEGLSRYFISGMYEGTWNIEVDGVSVAHRVSSEEGGIITFYAPAGEVHVKPGKDIAPSNGGRIVYNSFGGIVPDDAPQVYEIGVPVTLPDNISRGRDNFLGWYTSPLFEEETRITEVIGTQKGKFQVYAKYKSFPVLEDFESLKFAFGEKNASYGDLTYVGSGKIGSFFETITDEETGNSYLAMSRTATDMQLDAGQNVADYIGTESAITYEIELAKNGDKTPMSSSFRLRESSNKQVVTIFSTATDGTVKFGSKTLFTLSEEFQKIIITVDFAAGKMTAYNLFGDEISTLIFAVPSASDAENTLDWSYALTYTFNWWIGGGESILVDNVKVYCGAYDPEEIVLPEGEARIIYKTGVGSLPEGYPLTYKVGEPLTLPTPTVDNGTFIGWYTTESFDEDTKISAIDSDEAKTVTVYAKYALTVFEEDFTTSSVDIDATSSTIEGILYQFGSKTGSTAKAVTDELGNTYIRVYTDANDASINNFADAASAALASGGKITYSIDLATNEDGRSGASNFRWRASSTSDILSIFTTSGGTVYLAGDSALPVMTLTTKLQRLIITIDICESTMTAYNTYGEVIASKNISAPAVSGISSLEEWVTTLSYNFNWHISKNGGISFDNINIYTGEYVATPEEIPENSVKINYQMSGGVFEVTPDRYVSNESVFTLPTDISNGNYIFVGWFTSPSFEENTRITEIPVGLEGEITVYAKWVGTILKEDFTDSSVDVDASNATIDNIQYQMKDKTGTTAKTVTDESGNTYIKIFTDAADGSVNNYTSLAGQAASGGGKITYTIELATHDDGRSGKSDFRLRATSSSDILSLFTVQNGNVYLGAGTTVKIATLTTELQRIAVTLDVNGGTITAYNLYGEVIARSNVSVPTASSLESLEEWVDSTKNCFNWYFSKNGGIAFDNINIYVGGYIPETEVIPEGHTKVTYETNGGTFVQNPDRYAPTADAAFTLPTDISNGDYTFCGWFTSPNFEDGTQITALPVGSPSEMTVYAKWIGKVFSQDFTGLDGAAMESANGNFTGVGLHFTASNMVGAKLEIVKDESGNEYLVFNRGEASNDPQLRYNSSSISPGADGKITFHISLALPDEGTNLKADFRVRKYSANSTFTDFKLFGISSGGAITLGESGPKIADLTAEFTNIIITYDAVNLTLTAYRSDGEVIGTSALSSDFGTEWATGIGTPMYFRATDGDALKIDNIWFAECGFDATLF